MQVHYCDVCGQLLKNWDDVYVMGICKSNKTEDEQMLNQMRRGNGLQSIEEINNHMEAELQRRAEKLQMFEVCEKCKLVFDHFVNLRREELQEIKESIEKSMEDNNG